MPITSSSHQFWLSCHEEGGRVLSDPGEAVGTEDLKVWWQRAEKKKGAQGSRVWEPKAVGSVSYQCDSLGPPFAHL